MRIYIFSKRYPVYETGRSANKRLMIVIYITNSETIVKEVINLILSPVQTSLLNIALFCTVEIHTIYQRFSGSLKMAKENKVATTNMTR